MLHVEGHVRKQVGWTLGLVRAGAWAWAGAWAGYDRAQNFLCLVDSEQKCRIAQMRTNKSSSLAPFSRSGWHLTHRVSLIAPVHPPFEGCEPLQGKFCSLFRPYCLESAINERSFPYLRIRSLRNPLQRHLARACSGQTAGLPSTSSFKKVRAFARESIRT